MSRYMVAANEQVEKDKLYSLEEAVTQLKALPERKFDETIELSYFDAKENSSFFPDL